MLHFERYDNENVEDNLKVYNLLKRRERDLITSKNKISDEFEDIIKLYNLIKEHNDVMKTIGTGGVADDLISIKEILEKSKEIIDEGFHHYALPDGIDQGEIKKCLEDREIVFQHMVTIITNLRKNRNRLIEKFNETKKNFLEDAKVWEEGSEQFNIEVSYYNDNWKNPSAEYFYYSDDLESDYFSYTGRIDKAKKITLDFLE